MCITIEGNKIQSFILQHGFILSGALIMCISILKFYNPEQTTNWNELIIGSGLGFTFITLNILFLIILKA